MKWKYVRKRAPIKKFYTRVCDDGSMSRYCIAILSGEREGSGDRIDPTSRSTKIE